MLFKKPPRPGSIQSSPSLFQFGFIVVEGVIRVLRHAQIVIGKVSEQRRLAVWSWLAEMAECALTFFFTFEELQPPGLRIQ